MAGQMPVVVVSLRRRPSAPQMAGVTALLVKFSFDFLSSLYSRALRPHHQFHPDPAFVCALGRSDEHNPAAQGGIAMEVVG